MLFDKITVASIVCMFTHRTVLHQYACAKI